MEFAGSELWLSPGITVAIAGMMAPAAGIALLISYAIWSDPQRDGNRTASALATGLSFTGVLLAVLAVIGFVMSDQDRRQAQDALVAQVEEVYGLELHRDVTPGLLVESASAVPYGLYDLEAGGPVQMRKNIGWVAVVVDGRDRSFRLSWNGEHWTLQDYHDERWHDLRPTPTITTTKDETRP